MKFRPDHLQRIAAAKAGFSERTARRIETNRRLAPQPDAVRTRQGPDPFDGYGPLCHFFVFIGAMLASFIEAYFANRRYESSIKQRK